MNSRKEKNMIKFVNEIRAKFPGQTHIVAFNRQTVWGFPNFLFGLGSYKEAVIILRIIMD